MRSHGFAGSAGDLRRRLRHVYWIGGGPGAGKSTLARRLADRYGLGLYVTDHVMAEHARRSTATDAPYLERFKAMDMDERWLHRSPQTMLETFHWFRGEGFGHIVQDLLAMPAWPPVVAEGLRLLPHLVQPLLSEPSRAVWLLPTAAFRRRALDRRGPTHGIAHKTSDPKRADGNLAERDRLFADRLDEETRRLGLPVLRQDTDLDEDEALDRVARLLGLA